MAKSVVATKTAEYKMPSRFGSHTSMVVADREDGTVVCRDEFGDYWTYKDRLDIMLSDPSRYTATHRLVKSKEEAASIADWFGPGAVIVKDAARDLSAKAPETLVMSDK